MSEPKLNVDIQNEAGWPIQSFDSLCSLISRGTAPVYVEHSEVLAIGQRCIAPTGFASDFARPHSHRAMRNVLRPRSGDVLLNSTGTGTIGRSVVFNSPGTFIVDGHVTVMRPRTELADSRWLNSVLRTPSLQRHLERFCFAGSTNQLELSRTPLRVSRLPTPNIADQRAIGLVIDTLDTAIYETEAIIAKLKAVKQGLVHDLLTRGIDANGDLRPPQAEAPHLYKPSPLGWIPQEWDLRQLQQITSVIVDGTHFTPKYTDSGVPFLRVTDVQSEHIDLENVKFISAVEHQILTKRCKPQLGDILLSKNGTVGIAKLVDWQWEFSIFVSLALIRSRDTNRVINRYLVAVINSEIIKRQIKKRSKQGTVTNLHLEEIREFEIPLPSPGEQERLARSISDFEDKLNLECETLEKLRLQKSGLMDDLLTGRVRVTPLLAEAVREKRSA